jgi:hypothetical protein
MASLIKTRGRSQQQHGQMEDNENRERDREQSPANDQDGGSQTSELTELREREEEEIELSGDETEVEIITKKKKKTASVASVVGSTATQEEQADEQLRVLELKAKRTRNRIRAIQLLATQKRLDGALEYYDAQLAAGVTDPDMSAWADVWGTTGLAQGTRNGSASMGYKRKSPLDAKVAIKFDGKDQQNLHSFLFHLNSNSSSFDWSDTEWVLCAQSNMTTEMTHEWTRYVTDRGGDLKTITKEECIKWMSDRVCPPGLRAVLPMKQLLKEYMGLAGKPTGDIIERVNRARQEATDENSTAESVWVVLAYLACSEGVQAHLMSGFEKVPDTMQELIRRHIAIKHLVEPAQEFPRPGGNMGNKRERSWSKSEVSRTKRQRAGSPDGRADSGQKSSAGQQASTTQATRNAGTTSRGCWKCGLTDHIRQDCVAPDCTKCGDKGHITAKHGEPKDKETSKVAAIGKPQ